ncbi:MAG: response regulator [Longimicrobiales bacterium]
MARPVVSVIDPDLGVRESLRALLDTLGLDACTYTSAEGFLKSLRENAVPDCLITELQLHGMSGMDLQRRLRDEGVCVPVIVLATDADVPTAVACMQSGAAHFMEKPIVGPDLAQRIRRLLDPTAAGAAATRDAMPRSRATRHDLEVTMSTEKTVLIIDDDEDFQASLGAFLESEGYRVVHALSGRDGLVKLKECQPDAIFLDIMMETMNEGYGVAFTIKHQPEYERFQDVPLIMLSSIREDPDQRFPRSEEAELIRPDRYLTKPVDLDLLLATLARTLQH